MRQISEEDRKWFQEAMEAHTEDVSKRLRGIKNALESKADVPEDVDEKLRLLDDLTEIVENIDYARGEVHFYCFLLAHWCRVHDAPRSYENLNVVEQHGCSALVTQHQAPAVLYFWHSPVWKGASAGQAVCL